MSQSSSICINCPLSRQPIVRFKLPCSYVGTVESGWHVASHLLKAIETPESSGWRDLLLIVRFHHSKLYIYYFLNWSLYVQFLKFRNGIKLSQDFAIRFSLLVDRLTFSMTGIHSKIFKCPRTVRRSWLAGSWSHGTPLSLNPYARSYWMRGRLNSAPFTGVGSSGRNFLETSKPTLLFLGDFMAGIKPLPFGATPTR